MSSEELGGFWPALPFEEWRETYGALHMWTQVVGKVKLGMNPTVNHWWHVPLYVSARGLTTSAMHYGERVFQQFRSDFTGKSSPVHFFWGSFDLAVTRFSGRRAPEHPGTPGVADSITREAYSHEVSSAGFWPGGPALPEPVFYSYAYPEPEGFKDARVRPERAYYNNDFKEFVLPYEAVRASENPDMELMFFLQDTYEAAANAAKWDRAALER